MKARTRDEYVADTMYNNVAVELDRALHFGLDTVAQSLSVSLALIALKMHPDDFAEQAAKRPQNQ